MFTREDIRGLLRDEDFDFYFRGRRLDHRTYFAPTSEHAEIMRERSVLTTLPEHCWVLDGYEELVHEAAREARAWSGFSGDSEANVHIMCRDLSRYWEPDFVLLAPTSDGMYQAGAAAVCFPSGWAPTEIKSKYLHEIHSPVPGLNDAVAKKIYTLFNGLEGGTAWGRANWSFAATPELNLHATRGLTRLDNHPGKPIYFRAEFQIIYKLPRTGGILFGIRIVRLPLSELLDDPAIARNFERLMNSMPLEMRQYKGITQSVERILGLIPK